MGKDIKGKELGEGISQRRDGRYVARFTDRFGNRPEIKNTNLSQLKIDFENAKYLDRMKQNVKDNSMTLDTWFEKWLTIYKYNVLRENSKRYYITVYKKHISPYIGKKKIGDITQIQIIEIIKKLEVQGYQYETKSKVKNILIDMYGKAMVNEYVAKNPAKGIKIIRDESKDVRVLSLEEQTDFFECCKGTFYNNLFVVAVTSGIRPGELCGLTQKDLDFENKLINVNKTLLYQKLDGDEKKEFHFDPPKTKSSYRKVPMNKQCELALKKQIMQKSVVVSKAPQSKIPSEEFKDILFTTKFNTPINAQTYCDAIKRIVDEINLCRDSIDEYEYFSGHCLRHTFATRCFESGIQPKTVQKYLGHATLQMTMDLYTHVLETHKQSEMKKLENNLDGMFDVSNESIEKRYSDFKDENRKANIIKFTAIG